LRRTRQASLATGTSEEECDSACSQAADLPARSRAPAYAGARWTEANRCDMAGKKDGFGVGGWRKRVPADLPDVRGARSIGASALINRPGEAARRAAGSDVFARAGFVLDPRTVMRATQRRRNTPSVLQWKKPHRAACPNRAILRSHLPPDARMDFLERAPRRVGLSRWYHRPRPAFAGIFGRFTSLEPTRPPHAIGQQLSYPQHAHREGRR
jgi:hypothetical protein